jgi:hypothetical protein
MSSRHCSWKCAFVTKYHWTVVDELLIRHHTPVNVSLRQHTSVNVSHTPPAACQVMTDTPDIKPVDSDTKKRSWWSSNGTLVWLTLHPEALWSIHYVHRMQSIDSRVASRHSSVRKKCKLTSQTRMQPFCCENCRHPYSPVVLVTSFQDFPVHMRVQYIGMLRVFGDWTTWKRVCYCLLLKTWRFTMLGWRGTCHYRT